MDFEFNMKRLKGKFATNTLWSTIKYLRSNVATQLYTHKYGFNASYNLQQANNEQFGHSLDESVHDYKAPDYLTFNGEELQVVQKKKIQENV